MDYSPKYNHEFHFFICSCWLGSSAERTNSIYIYIYSAKNKTLNPLGLSKLNIVILSYTFLLSHIPRLSSWSHIYALKQFLKIRNSHIPLFHWKKHFVGKQKWVNITKYKLFKSNHQIPFVNKFKIQSESDKNLSDSEKIPDNG